MTFKPFFFRLCLFLNVLLGVRGRKRGSPSLGTFRTEAVRLRCTECSGAPRVDLCRPGLLLRGRYPNSTLRTLFGLVRPPAPAPPWSFPSSDPPSPSPSPSGVWSAEKSAAGLTESLPSSPGGAPPGPEGPGGPGGDGSSPGGRRGAPRFGGGFGPMISSSSSESGGS